MLLRSNMSYLWVHLVSCISLYKKWQNTGKAIRNRNPLHAGKRDLYEVINGFLHSMVCLSRVCVSKFDRNLEKIIQCWKRLAPVLLSMAADNQKVNIYTCQVQWVQSNIMGSLRITNILNEKKNKTKQKQVVKKQQQQQLFKISAAWLVLNGFWRLCFYFHLCS